jgi:hypothetical protein
MDKRNIIIFGAGFLVGYLFLKVINKNKTIREDVRLPDNSSQKLPPASTNQSYESGITKIEEPEVIDKLEDPKITECKNKWIKFAEKRKFSSEEQAQNTYDNFMTSCVAQS